jgi:microcin C transport system substrate-binding protein
MRIDIGRSALRVASVAAALVFAASAALAEPRHGLSSFGDLKYPADFTHFDYVNPEAPKGGRLALVGTRGLATFDSFNGYILRGDAAQGTSLLFEGFSLIFDTLMTSAGDEPDSMYGLVAKSADLADDKLSVTFTLRPEAKFADGSPLTAEDVKFSFDILKSDGHPIYRTILRDVVSAEVLTPDSIKYTFQGEAVRDLPQTVAGLPIFSKAFYATRTFNETTLEPPLGSGPYVIDSWRQGRSVTYQRRDDYWAKDLPVNRGRWNFDEIRFEYFRDRTAALETLKAGGYDLREEFTSKDWATAYDIPQVRSGRMVLTTLDDERPSGAQGFFLNTRREKFKDIRVRQALDLAFDFEWTNKNLFYSLYKRTSSYFENSPLKATGLPSPAELELLEPFRAQLPESVFQEPYSAPVSDGSGSDRRLLRRAVQLLEEAGFKRSGNGRANADGVKLDIEFLIFSPSFKRVIQPYIRNLERIGLQASIRQVDPAQFERRTKSFDFDIVTQRFVMGLTPSVSMRNYLSSASADAEGSRNLSGIKDPVIDDLVEKAIKAKSREELTTAARALDRVLRAGHYWVPHWYKAAHNIAHWNRYSRPATKPKYDDGVIDTWWFDAAKAEKADG